MNIIIFPRPKAKHIYASNPLHGASKFALSFAVVAVSAVLLGGGYLLGISFGHKTILNEWKADVERATRTFTACKTRKRDSC